MSRKGFSAEASRGSQAERAFESALRWWFGSTGEDDEHIIISRPTPDNLRVDFITRIDGDGTHANSIVLYWQIKESRAAKRRKGVSIRLDVAYVLDLYWCSVNEHSPLFLVIAVPIAQELRQSDRERDQFEWYAVDIVQYIDQQNIDLGASAQASITVTIPLQNRLNAAIASLIWSAEWVRVKFGSWRTESTTSALRQIDQQLRRPTAANMGDVLLSGRIALNSLQELTFYQQVVASIGMGMNWLSALIMRKALESNQISYLNYPTETEGPWINLWLFNRQYRTYLYTLSRMSREAGGGDEVCVFFQTPDWT